MVTQASNSSLAAAPKQDLASLRQVPHLIGGDHIARKGTRFGIVYNPATGKAIARLPFASKDLVNECVAVAKAASKRKSRFDA